MGNEIPEGLVQEALKALEIARNTGKVRRGTNEATKQVERGEAKLVYIAGDVQPPEIVAHLPALCNDKGIPYIHVSAKLELGQASGIEVPCASVVILDVGGAKKQVSAIAEKLTALRKGKAPKEDKAEKKEEPKAEKKPEAKKEEPKAEEKPKEEPKAEKKPEPKEEKKEEKKPEVKEEKAEKPKAEKEAKPEKKEEKPKEAKPEKKEKPEKK